MSSPCICVGDSTDISFSACKVHYLSDTTKYVGAFQNIQGHRFDKPKVQIERFIQIAEWAYSIVKDCDEIMIEGYSMGSHGNTFDIGENTGILKYKLYTKGLRYGTVPPTSLKKFAAGKGNSDKNVMYEAFIKETKNDLKTLFNYKGVKIGNPLSDIVDSYYLMKYLKNNPLE